jgi:hypothetical protein
MNQLQSLVTAALALALAPLLLSGVAGEQPPAEPNRVLPEEACAAIVREANQFIREALEGPRPGSASRPSPPDVVIRANALLIALAAQNRMGGRGAEARQLATLRDAALDLGKAVEKRPFDRAKVARLARALGRFPDLEPSPHARLVRHPLKDRFSHDDVAFLFGGCNGGKGHRIQLDVLRFARQKTPFTRAEREELGRMAYKVALLGELLLDFDDFITVRSAERRKDWVRLAGGVRDAAWELAEGTRAKDFDRASRAIHKVNGACVECHRKFL